ncbi:MAG: YceI family protein [Bdellovibrionales bacterium]|jgi:polyisoprenoid-binding protein YceI
MRTRLATVLFLAFIGMISAPSVSAAAGTYYAPPQQCKTSFVVTDMASKQLFSGDFQDATGSFHYDEGTHTVSRLRFAIDARSLQAPQTSRSRSAEMFAITQNPEISFASDAPVTLKDGAGAIKGTLTLHGKSQAASFDATLAKAEGRGQLRLTLTGKVKREAYGMTVDPTPEQPETGLGDTIALTLEMQGITP